MRLTNHHVIPIRFAGIRLWKTLDSKVQTAQCHKLWEQEGTTHVSITINGRILSFSGQGTHCYWKFIPRPSLPGYKPIASPVVVLQVASLASAGRDKHGPFWGHRTAHNVKELN